MKNLNAPEKDVSLQKKFEDEYAQEATARERELMFKKTSDGRYTLMQVFNAWQWYERGYKQN